MLSFGPTWRLSGLLSVFPLRVYHYYRVLSDISPVSDATVFPLRGHIIDLLCDSSLTICVFFLGKLCAAYCSLFLRPRHWCEKTPEFQARRSRFLRFPHVAKVALPACRAVVMQTREHTHTGVPKLHPAPNPDLVVFAVLCFSPTVNLSLALCRSLLTACDSTDGSTKSHTG